MENGYIQVNSGNAQVFGFIKDKYEGYLWKDDGAIWISFIECRNPGQGHFSQLVENILNEGYMVKVPTPLGQMVEILMHKGFIPTHEQTELGGLEVWIKYPIKMGVG